MAFDADSDQVSSRLISEGVLPESMVSSEKTAEGNL